MRRIINNVFYLLGNFNFARYRYAITLMLIFVLNSETYAQLPVFNLNVVKTDETCLGNGTLSFSVVNINPLAAITFRVYKLPNVTNPVSISNPTVGLQNGTYRVVAFQTLNALFNSQMLDIEIENNIVDLDFAVQSVSSGCGDNGTMSIVITSGIGVGYEIISGPVTKPLQSSPIFSAMPPGVYEIRVFDNCGAGSVKTFTLVSGAPVINISPAAFNPDLPTCNTIEATNTLTPAPNSILTYPIQVTYTITPPGGGTPLTISESFSTGPPNLLTLTNNIPFYHDQPYNLSVSATDGCGTIFTHNEVVNQKLQISIIPKDAICGTFFLQTVVSLFKGPYTLNFTTYPAGFNASALNIDYPIYNISQVDFGDAGNTVPFGQYVVTVTDACGRTATADYLLEEIEIDPLVQIFPYIGCLSGSSRVEVKVLPYMISTAVITHAPVGYPFSLPHNVSSYVNEQGILVMTQVATGDYTIELTDTCGNIYDPVDFFVPPMDTHVSSIYRTDCTDPTVGTIKLAGVGTTLTSVIITQAPAAFTQSVSLPNDVSALISDGAFTMAGLPVGHYLFKVMDNCGAENTVARYIAGYSVTAQDLVVIPHCGAFDIQLTHVSNSAPPKFWLQRFNSVTGNWENPATNSPYVENSLPSASDSYEIQGNATTLNLTFNGDFRILKSFESFDNGNVSAIKNCVVLLYEFTFDGEFEVTGYEKITCDGTRADIRILTNGVAPFIFRIVKKNGLPFFIENGDNNIFTNLEPALYHFTVQHSCGDIIPGSFDVSALPAAVIAHQPPNLFQCDDDGVAEFDLSSQTAAVFAQQDASTATISFHLSAQDALMSTNEVTTLENFSSEGNQTIYVRLQHNNTMCFDTTSFTLNLQPNPVLQMSKEWAICDDSEVTITADPGYLYLWSTGETTSSITVQDPGIYQLTATSVFPDGSCSATFDIEVFPSAPPNIVDIKTVDWTDQDNSIEVVLSNNSDHFEYSLDNVTYQVQNIFTGLSVGSYTIYVRDIFGCGVDFEKVYLLNYPKFFTPNGDGFNDTWRIKFSELEPGLKTYIYDRYGKVITGFLPDSEGWDGTLNGSPLPSTDYWFVVERQDGTMFRGHFAMKR